MKKLGVYRIQTQSYHEIFNLFLRTSLLNYYTQSQVFLYLKVNKITNVSNANSDVTFSVSIVFSAGPTMVNYHIVSNIPWVTKMWWMLHCEGVLRGHLIKHKQNTQNSLQVNSAHCVGPLPHTFPFSTSALPYHIHPYTHYPLPPTHHTF